MLPSGQSQQYQLFPRNCMHLRRSALVVVVLCTACFAATQHGATRAHSKLLPITTSSPAARKLFQQGMVNMENLRTEWALAGWRAATKRDPNFAQAQILVRSEEHTSELQSHVNLVCRLL